MNTDNILKLALIALAVAAPILLTLLSRGGLKALGAWKEKILAETKSGLAREAIARLLHIAEAVVLDIEVTLKPAIVAALEDKEITKDEAEHLKKVAIQRLKSILTEQGKEELLGFLGIASGALDIYLGGVVEKAVVSVKTEAAKAEAIKKVEDVGLTVPSTPPSKI